MHKLILVTLSLEVCATGCSTMATIRTDPTGARVYVNGRYVGQSPVEVELRDGFSDEANHYAKVELEGYETQEGRLQQHWSAGGIIVDILLLLPTFTGSFWLGYFNAKRHEDEYVFPMPPARRPAPAPAAAGAPTQRPPAAQTDTRPRVPAPSPRPENSAWPEDLPEQPAAPSEPPTDIQ